MEVEKTTFVVKGQPRQTIKRVKDQPQIQKEDLKMETKKANGKVSKAEVKEKAKKTEEKKAPEKDGFGLMVGSKASQYLQAVIAAKAKGVTMGEIKNLPWNTQRVTFYKLSARLEKAGLLTMKDGKFFAKEQKREKEPRPHTAK